MSLLFWSWSVPLVLDLADSGSSLSLDYVFLDDPGAKQLKDHWWLSFYWFSVSYLRQETALKVQHRCWLAHTKGEQPTDHCFIKLVPAGLLDGLISDRADLNWGIFTLLSVKPDTPMTLPDRILYISLNFNVPMLQRHILGRTLQGIYKLRPVWGHMTGISQENQP